MDVDRYGSIKISPDSKTFSFVSTGPKGDLVKIVQFIPFGYIANTHNLALGTKRNDIVDFNETTNNGDRDQILATIFHIAKAFSSNHPGQKIFIRGRNNITTRLYRGAINHGYKEFIAEFSIYGEIYFENERRYKFEQFTRNKQYDAFYLKGGNKLLARRHSSSLCFFGMKYVLENLSSAGSITISLPSATVVFFAGLAM